MILRSYVMELVMGLILLCQGVFAQSQVTWTSPPPGSIFIASGLLNASWTAPKEVVSPSFKLCVKPTARSSPSSNSRRSAWTKRSPKELGAYGDEANQAPVSWNSRQSDDPASSPNSTVSSSDCGESVWPTVRQDDADNEYSISLSVPEVSSSDTFYLLMQSNFGDLYRSPTFQVLSNSDATLTQGSSTMTSLAANGAPSAVLSSATDVATGTPVLRPVGPLSPSFTIDGAAVSNSPPQSANVSPSTPPQMAVSPNSKSSKAVAAAVGVPLSIMAAAASFGTIICLWSRRKKQKRFNGQEVNLSNASSSTHGNDGAPNHLEKGSNVSVEMEKGPIDGQTAREPAHLGLPHLHATVPAAVSQAPGYIQPTNAPYLAMKPLPLTPSYHQRLVMAPGQQSLFSSHMRGPPIRTVHHTAAAEQPYYDPGIYTAPVPRPTLNRFTVHNDRPYRNWPNRSVSRTNSVTSSESGRSLPSILRPGVSPSWTLHGLDGSLTPPSLPTPPLISGKTVPSIPYMSEVSRGGAVSLPSAPVNYATRPVRR